MARRRHERAFRQRFARLVDRAVRRLPPEVWCYLENVAILIADEPTPEQRAAAGGRDLFGLYEGVPRPQRDGQYTMVLPDRITLFRRPLEAACRSERELLLEIQRTIVHEIAHHVGLSEEEIRALGWE